MSNFAVTVEKISSIAPADNSDNLDIARLSRIDYQFVVQKGVYSVGDFVIYFPVDSVLPDTLIEKLGLTGRLAGSSKNRVKTIKLRGNLSQGVVAKGDILTGIIPPYDYNTLTEGDDVTEYLGVVKYEPPESFGSATNFNGRRITLPSHVFVYDIEGAQNHKPVVEMLLDKDVHITEKLEGTHWWLSVDVDDYLDDNTQFMFGSRRQQVLDMDNIYGRATEQILPNLPTLVGKSLIAAWNINARTITFRGEIVGNGIQGNIYKMPNIKLYLFDIEVDGKYIAARKLPKVCSDSDVAYVPVIAQDIKLSEWLAGRTVVEASTFKSSLRDTLAEGIVIKPSVEDYHAKIGRIIVKQRSPEYLAKTDM